MDSRGDAERGTGAYSRRNVLSALLAAGASIAGVKAWFESDRETRFGFGRDFWKGEPLPETRADPADVFVHGWYPSWAVYGDDRYRPEDVSFDKHGSLSAFSVRPNKAGKVVHGDELADPKMLSSFATLKREGGPAAATPVHLTVGGWGSSRYFSNAALTGESRELFASSAVSTMRRHGLDGIDVDWEYPTGDSGRDNVEREEDVDNVVLLLEALREHLDAASDEDGRDYALTYAAPYQRERIRALRTEEMDRYIDYWFVMAFEMAGEWAPETRHDSPNYPSKAYDAPHSTDRAMTDWLRIGNVRRDKLVFETGFYGKVFGGVSPGPRGDGLGQPYEEYLGVIGRREAAALEAAPEWETHWDEDAEAAYMYNESDGRWITYATPQTMEAKAAYLFEEGFAGVTGWETSRDPDDELLDALRASFPDPSGE